VLREGVKRLREVFAQSPFDAYRGPELAPGPDVRSDAEIEAWIRRTAESVYHITGTCRMGADPAAVVDASLRVRGVDGLRVADASVMPAITSTNTAAPTMMIAERAAELILSNR
jgi:choline dehydrogenase